MLRWEYVHQIILSSDGVHHKIGEVSGWRWGICTAGADKNHVPWCRLCWPLHEREGRLRLKYDGTAQKPDFVFRRNGGVHLNRRGRQFSRLLAAEVWASAVVMLDTPWSVVVWRVLATQFIRQFSLHFPSRTSPCAITFQLKSTTLYPTEKQKWTYHGRIRFPTGKLPRHASSYNMLGLWVRKWLVDDSYAR